MPVDIDYRPSSRGFRMMASGPEAQRVVVSVAEVGKAWCEADAQSFRVSGEYAASFVVEAGVAVVANSPRAAGILRNTADHAAAVEWGNDRTNGRSHRVLGRMLDALTGRP